MIVARLADLDSERLFGAQARRSEEMQAVVDWLAAQFPVPPEPTTLPPRAARALSDMVTLRLREPPGEERARYATIPGGDGAPLALKIVAPPGPARGTILYLHGGGWCFGNLETHDGVMRSLARACGRMVVGVDYRLAPEHPYPAGLDDAAAAWSWLQGRIGEDDFPRPVAFAGDSSGGNLAFALALREQAWGGVAPDALVLMYAVLDDDFDTPSYRRFGEGFGLPRARMETFFRWYAPGRDRSDPLTTPLKASDAALRRLPPVYLNAAGLDPLLSDTLAMAARLEALGHPFRLALHEGLHHGFHHMYARIEQARQAMATLGAWLEAQTPR